ncbi:unnamed protein product [Trichogramma brassicae]|uniref:Uncharacterized protein n=1 Tax=Trichogramma brassicae TaxID=86971 RepID=A0A6H5IQW3_9HYME|nr:unnamed protein product [Trichogramma brassicae]
MHYTHTDSRLDGLGSDAENGMGRAPVVSRAKAAPPPFLPPPPLSSVLSPHAARALVQLDSQNTSSKGLTSLPPPPLPSSSSLPSSRRASRRRPSRRGAASHRKLCAQAPLFNPFSLQECAANDSNARTLEASLSRMHAKDSIVKSLILRQQLMHRSLYPRLKKSSNIQAYDTSTNNFISTAVAATTTRITTTTMLRSATNIKPIKREGWMTEDYTDCAYEDNHSRKCVTTSLPRRKAGRTIFGPLVKIKAVLVAHDLLEIIEGTETKPEPGEDKANATKVKEWTKKDAKAMFALSSSIDYSQLDYLVNCASANEKWKKLSNIHEQKSTSNKLALTTKFHEYRKSPNDSIAQHPMVHRTK